MTKIDDGGEYTVPVHPFYKDERIVGGRITVKVSFRLLIASLILFVFLIGFVSLKLIGYTEDNHRLTVQVQQAIQEGRAQRLEAQRRTDLKIQELVCLVIKDAPDSRGPLVKSLRTKYKCPPYVAKAKGTVAHV